MSNIPRKIPALVFLLLIVLIIGTGVVIATGPSSQAVSDTAADLDSGHISGEQNGMVKTELQRSHIEKHNLIDSFEVNYLYGGSPDGVKHEVYSINVTLAEDELYIVDDTGEQRPVSSPITVDIVVDGEIVTTHSTRPGKTVQTNYGVMEGEGPHDVEIRVHTTPVAEMENAIEWTDRSNDEDPSSDSSDVSGSHGYDHFVDRHFTPPFDTPFINFYPDYTEPAFDDEEDSDIDDDERPDRDDLVGGIEIGETRGLDEVLEAAGDGDPAAFGEMFDVAFLISPGMFEFDGVTLGEYRISQLYGIPVSLDHSKVMPVEDVNDWYIEESDSGVIKDAYIINFGSHPSAIYQYRTQEPQPNPPRSTRDPDPEYNYHTHAFAASEGEIMTFLDYRIDEDELTEDNVYDYLTFFEDGDSDNPPTVQRQARDTYHVEHHYVERSVEMWMENYDVKWTAGHDYMMGGATTNYAQRVADNATFFAFANITVEEYKYEWTRERNWVTEPVSTDAETYIEDEVKASGYVETTVNLSNYDEGDPIEVTTHVTSDERHEYTKDGEWSYTANIPTQDVGDSDRYELKTYEGEKVITDSIYLDGVVTDTIPAPEGNGTTIVTGEISGTYELSSEMVVNVDVDIEYFGYWGGDPSEHPDGGWELAQKFHHETHEVEVSSRGYESIFSENREIDVDQHAIKVSDEEYHVYMQIDQGFDGNTITEEEFLDSYLWSLITFGPEAWVESDWKSVPMTTFDYAEYRDDRSADYVIDVPNVIETYLISEPTGPQLVSSHQDMFFEPQMLGWAGHNVSIKEAALESDNVTINSARPVMYTSFTVQSVPKPADNIVSIHGTQREITEEQTNIIEYVEPEVELEVDDGDLIIEVNDPDRPNYDTPYHLFDVTVDVEGEVTEVNLDGNGRVRLNDAVDAFQYVEVEVKGHDVIDGTEEDWEAYLADDPDVYYGSVTASSGLGELAVIRYLMGVVRALIFSIPLILFLILWRDYELGS